MTAQMTAAAIARVRWQRHLPVWVAPCGCRDLVDGDPVYPEQVRRVATCWVHRAPGVGTLPLQPWVQG